MCFLLRCLSILHTITLFHFLLLWKSSQNFSSVFQNCCIMDFHLLFLLLLPAFSLFSAVHTDLCVSILKCLILVFPSLKPSNLSKMLISSLWFINHQAIVLYIMISSDVRKLLFCMLLHKHKSFRSNSYIWKAEVSARCHKISLEGLTS